MTQLNTMLKQQQQQHKPRMEWVSPVTRVGHLAAVNLRLFRSLYLSVSTAVKHWIPLTLCWPLEDFDCCLVCVSVFICLLAPSLPGLALATSLSLSAALSLTCRQTPEHLPSWYGNATLALVLQLLCCTCSWEGSLPTLSDRISWPPSD